MTEEKYLTVKNPASGIFRDRGSKFISNIFPVSMEEGFRSQLMLIKKEHHGANHHCWAFRLAKDNISKSNDDREPAGSAGKPILGQLLSNRVHDAAIVVSRYFGGSLLGVPGLINAYKSAAADAIAHAEMVEKEIMEKYGISFDYSLMNDIMKLLKQQEAAIQQQETNNRCHIEFEISKSNAALLVHSIKHDHRFTGNVDIKPKKI